MSSDGLRLTVQPGDRLNIPLARKKKQKKGYSTSTSSSSLDTDDGDFAIRQDVDSHEYKLASVLGQIPGVSSFQAERYVECLVLKSILSFG